MAIFVVNSFEKYLYTMFFRYINPFDFSDIRISKKIGRRQDGTAHKTRQATVLSNNRY